MKCIDAVEGVAKAMLETFMDVSAEYRMDVSEYIRNVKAIIDGVTLFVKNNPEVSDSPEIIRGVLYDSAKAQWLARLEKSFDPERMGDSKPDLEYQAYSYDYIYAHGNYPR